jgi:hypothetical protein
MQYTKRSLVVSQSRVSEAVEPVANRREVVEQRPDVRHPAADAIASLLLMEQSLLSMKRFLATLERDLQASLGLDKPLRHKAARYRAKADNDELAQHVMDLLRDQGIVAQHVNAPAAAPEPTPPVHRNGDGPDLRKQ